MRNKFVLLCDKCGYLGTDYYSEETKYLCPYCENKQLRELDLKSIDYDNYIYQDGYPSYNKCRIRMDEIRKKYMIDYSEYNKEIYENLECYRSGNNIPFFKKTYEFSDEMREKLRKDTIKYSGIPYMPQLDDFHLFTDEEIAEAKEIEDRRVAEEQKKKRKQAIEATRAFDREQRKIQRETGGVTRYCPICHSDKVRIIPFTSKFAHAVFFGWMSKTTRSQFECKNCGYKF